MNQKNELEVKAREKAQSWLSDSFDEITRSEVKLLLESNREEDRRNLVDAFYKNIDFGTGGVRGVMGVGTNRINRYTLAKVTYGLVRFAEKNFPSEVLKVAIAHDTRNHSIEFSQQVADIFFSSGAKVYRFSEAMPTPLLSYAVRKLECKIGVVITASHNPKEYNGYKVYFDDGAQVVPPWDGLIIDEVNQVTGLVGIADSKKKMGKIAEIKEKVIDSYTKDIFSILNALVEGVDLSIPLVFSSIHGTGGKLIVPLLNKLGFQKVYDVPIQMEEDGNFPTVVYPNPEEREALSLGLEKMDEMDGEFLMATDPDADRLGVAVRNHKKKPLILNGNQIGILLTDFIVTSYMKNMKSQNGKSPFLVRTVVTTPLIDRIADEYGLELFRVLTGFKYIGELIRKFEGKKQFVFGLEESHGYLATDKVRDKDGVSSALLFAVMAAHYKRRGVSIYQRLCEIYEKYGFCFESLASLTKTGPEGKIEIAAMISSLRENYGGGKTKEILSERLRFYRDYGLGFELDFNSGKKSETNLPSSEVIQLESENHTLVTIRPSGTEPKIKFYFSIRIPLSGSGDIFTKVEEAQGQALRQIDKLKAIFIQ